MRKRIASSLLGKLRVFRRDTFGMAAIEFGLIAPLLMVMTFATIEYSRAYIVYKRFQRAASMVGDLVTREKQLWPQSTPDASATTADAVASLNGITGSAGHVMLPYTTDTLQFKIYQVWANSTSPTQTKVEWSYKSPVGSPGSPGSRGDPACASAQSVDTGVLQGNGRAVFVVATYTYKPLLANVIPNLIKQMNWTDTMVMAPRDAPSVLFLPGLNNSNTWDSPSKAACQ
jgi:Flp pilus assembly protein TadG